MLICGVSICIHLANVCVTSGRPSSAPSVREEVDPEDDADLELLKGALYKRKDFLGIEEGGICTCDVCSRACIMIVLRIAAMLHPSRTYYYRKTVDVDQAIEQCTRKVGTFFTFVLLLHMVMYGLLSHAAGIEPQ